MNGYYYRPFISSTKIIRQISDSIRRDENRRQLDQQANMGEVKSNYHLRNAQAPHFLGSQQLVGNSLMCLLWMSYAVF
jgi:hypothetical protein